MPELETPPPNEKFAIDDIDGWRALFPSMRLCDPRSGNGVVPFAIEEQTIEDLRRTMRHEGYFQLDPMNWGFPLPQMAEIVADLQRRRLPTGFAFIYDEFWLLFSRLHHLLRGLLGDEYKLRPDFWAWCVNADGDDAGWRPHRDGALDNLLADGSPKSLSIWIPLTDATPLNSCIYVLPAHLDPDYNIARSTAVPDSSNIRALPAAAGSILCWPPPLLHWGSRSAQRRVPPRISLAYEFQRGDVAPYNEPLLPPLFLPDFALRLRLVCKQVKQYQHMYPLTPAMSALVTSVIEKPVAAT